MSLAHITGPIAAHPGRHTRPPLPRRISAAIPRLTGRTVLTLIALAELAGAAGWTVGYGPSAAGAIAACNSLLLLALRWCAHA